METKEHNVLQESPRKSTISEKSEGVNLERERAAAAAEWLKFHCEGFVEGG